MISLSAGGSNTAGASAPLSRGAAAGVARARFSSVLAGVAKVSARPGVGAGPASRALPPAPAPPSVTTPFLMVPKAARFVVVAGWSLLAAGVNSPLRLDFGAPPFLAVLGGSRPSSASDGGRSARAGSAGGGMWGGGAYRRR